MAEMMGKKARRQRQAERKQYTGGDEEPSGFFRSIYELLFPPEDGATQGKVHIV